MEKKKKISSFLLQGLQGSSEEKYTTFTTLCIGVDQRSFDLGPDSTSHTRSPRGSLRRSGRSSGSGSLNNVYV